MSIVRQTAKVLAMSILCIAGLAAQPLHARGYISPSANSAKPDRDGRYRLIVGYRAPVAANRSNAPRMSTVSRSAQAAGINAYRLRRLAIGGDVVVTSSRTSRRALRVFLKALASDPNVIYVEEDSRLRPTFVPNDPGYVQQWHYKEPAVAPGINLPLAWDRATGTGVVVAVLDSGVTPHTDLDANLVSGYDFISDPDTSRDGDGRDSNPRDEGDWTEANDCEDDEPAEDSSWHGTHVAGTVAAVTNNGSGVSGVAFGAKVMPVRVTGKCGGFVSDISDAVIWASGGTVAGVTTLADPAEVINMSLGGEGACGTTYQTAINGAVSRGVTVVVSAGNENIDASGSRPANCNNVIAVAATNRSGGKASYSNFGATVDVAAPGGQFNGVASNGILSTYNLGTTVPAAQGYAWFTGTSMAAPHVSGIVALMQSLSVKTPAQIETILKTTARPLPVACPEGCGTGLVDAKAALDETLPPPPPSGGALANNVPVDGIAATWGNMVTFSLQVPVGASSLAFILTEGIGNADMYVRFGTPPTTSVFNCRNATATKGVEYCQFNAPQAGTWYVSVHAPEAFSKARLVGSFNVGTNSQATSTTVFAIPDPGTVASPLTATGLATPGPRLEVFANITHANPNQLRISLKDPQGNLYALLSPGQAGAGPNLSRNFYVNAALSTAMVWSTWELWVEDTVAGSSGTLQSWGMRY